ADAGGGDDAGGGAPGGGGDAGAGGGAATGGPGGGPSASAPIPETSVTDTVDKYMKDNWDQTSYQAHYARIGGAPTGPLGNPLLPQLNNVDNRTDSEGEPIPAPSDSAVAAANMVISVMSQVIDTGVDMALMMNPVTMPLGILKQVVQGGAAAAAYT